MPDSNKRIESIYDLLDNIERKPGTWIGTASLRSLRDFLNGFSVGQMLSALKDKEWPLFADFSAWFCGHHNSPCAGSGGWYGAITNESPDDAKAFILFFDYLSAYRRRVAVLDYRFSLTPAQQQRLAQTKGMSVPKQLRLTRCKGERCLFLHARPSKFSQGWYLQSILKSIPLARKYLGQVFAITGAQWKKAQTASSGE